ncbi:hypothetical protein KKI24_23700 [bacterium]|nr:hypothetical protein [bacterium]
MALTGILLGLVPVDDCFLVGFEKVGFYLFQEHRCRKEVNCVLYFLECFLA